VEDALEARPEDGHARFVEVWREGGRFGKWFDLYRQSTTAVSLLFRSVAGWRHPSMSCRCT